MKRLAALVALVSTASVAHAIPVQYEFSGLIDTTNFFSSDPIPPAITDEVNGLLGQSFSGSFWYDSQASLLFDPGPPFGAFYPNGMTDLLAELGGDVVTAGFAAARVNSVGLDFLYLQTPVTGTTGSVLGFAVRDFLVGWAEGAPFSNPLGSFLSSDSLPTVLPTEFIAQARVTLLIPGFATPSPPPFDYNAIVGSSAITVRAVSVPEPTTFALVTVALLALVAVRRPRQRAAS